MTDMHQRQSIEDDIKLHIDAWDEQNPIDVYFTCGYGPDLRWRLYEFLPKNEEFLYQLQYLQDPQTWLSRGYRKYSPPFGLLKLDQSDDRYFDAYLDQCMTAEWLADLGWTCFEEETQVDPDAFQACLLDMMCKLYLSTSDFDVSTCND